MPANSRNLAQKNSIEVYAQVIHALMLRDMRTRFGGSHWGYVVVVLWPVAHILLIVAIMWFRALPSPMGNNPTLFVATGAVPALMFQYTSREVMKAVIMNRPLTYYPQVKIFDVMLARFIVEVVKGFTALIVILIILLALGVDPTPEEPALVIGGYCLSILLGLGIGTINIGIISFFPGWMIGYIGVTITLYMTSGVFFLPHLLPDQIYEVLKWNPVVQIIEWVRVGYNPSLSVNVDYIYVVFFAFGSIAFGLIMERLLVRRMN